MQFTPPYRVGRKQKRAVLDSTGREVVTFPKGQEERANEYCIFLNANAEQVTFKAKHLKTNWTNISQEAKSLFGGILK